MNFIKQNVRVVIASFVLAVASAFTMIGVGVAAGPIFCTYESFIWQCADGSGTYLNDPEPPIAGHAGNGYFESVRWSGAGFGGNAYVQLGRGFSMRFKTTQAYVAWWDSGGNLNVVKSINNTATIPSSAVMIGIPGDVLGDFDIPGWVKGKRTDTGEYVLASTRWIKR
jgi:hypothetical protein